MYRGEGEAYEDQTDDGEDRDHDAAALAEREGVQLDERLRCIQGEEGVQVGSAEQEEDRGRESEATCRNDTGQNTASSDDAVVRQTDQYGRRTVRRG